jgi:hypothetical protein
MVLLTIGAIGGYLEIALDERGAARYPQAAAFQSARAALFALLETAKPQRIWMPRLICDAMIAPALSAMVEVKFYELTPDLRVAEQVKLNRTDWLLYVNYFGICGHASADALSRFGPERVILDHSQAFFTAPPDCLATIYSPRKFFGLPDGGLLVTQLPVPRPPETDTHSVDRMKHLLQRLDGSPEAGFPDYRAAEESLSDFRPRGMSVLTRKLFASYDMEAARARRNGNFKQLHDLLGKRNSVPLALGDVDGPLGYPYGGKRPELRRALIARRVFVPSYWTEVLGRAERQSVEEYWVTSVLPLPCDQRYGDEEMKEMAGLVQSLEESR